VFADPDRVPRPACALTSIRPDHLAPMGIHSVFLAPTGIRPPAPDLCGYA
jgi:hypothetical protein